MQAAIRSPVSPGGSPCCQMAFCSTGNNMPSGPRRHLHAKGVAKRAAKRLQRYGFLWDSTVSKLIVVCGPCLVYPTAATRARNRTALSLGILETTRRVANDGPFSTPGRASGWELAPTTHQINRQQDDGVWGVSEIALLSTTF